MYESVYLCLTPCNLLNNHDSLNDHNKNNCKIVSGHNFNFA